MQRPRERSTAVSSLWSEDAKLTPGHSLSDAAIQTETCDSISLISESFEIGVREKSPQVVPSEDICGHRTRSEEWKGTEFKGPGGGGPSCSATSPHQVSLPLLETTVLHAQVCSRQLRE